MRKRRDKYRHIFDVEKYGKLEVDVCFPEGINDDFFELKKDMGKVLRKHLKDAGARKEIMDVFESLERQARGAAYMYANLKDVAGKAYDGLADLGHFLDEWH